jgi:transposase-like protein
LYWKPFTVFKEKRKMKKVKGIDDALRLQIIKEHLSGASKGSLVRKYKLKSVQRITDWMRTFGLAESISAVPEGFMKHRKEKEEPEAVQALKQENKRLKAELAEARLRAKAYDTLIDVAEEMFGIPIRKKPGTKQS